MKRREFIALLGGAAAWPSSAPAQQPRMPVVGWISSRAASESAYLVAAFRQGLKQTGYVETQNVVVDFRWGDGYYDRLNALATELVRRPVTVIVATGGDPAAQAAKVATGTIPIVFVSGSDPVKVGLVASFNRPGGNISGVHLLLLGMGSKRLGLLHELVAGGKSNRGADKSELPGCPHSVARPRERGGIAWIRTSGTESQHGA
jgi:putative tryptophan/tyrosine transport system substrate-binding protein